MRLPSRDQRLGHASLARVACSTLEPMSLCARRSLVKRTLLTINHRVGGFLEMWSRVYVVIMLGMVGYNSQELAMVRRRGRFLTGCYVLGQEYVYCFWAVLVLSSDCPLFGSTVFNSMTLLASPTIFFYNLTNADTFCSPLYSLYDYSTIHLYRWIL
jgi:hypothetical protein